MAFNVAFLGIDGSGKGTYIDEIVRLLGKEYSILTLGLQSCFYTKDANQKEIFQEMKGSTSRALRRIIRSYLCPINKAKALKKYNPDICIEDRDQIIDPAVLASAYVPYSKHVSISKRIKFMEITSRSKFSDLYVYLDVSPEIALERIKTRNEKFGKEQSPHENLQDLYLLRNQYEEALSYLKENRFNLEKIDTGIIDIPQGTKSLADMLRKNINNQSL